VLPKHRKAPGAPAGNAFVFHYPFDVFISTDLPDQYEISGGGRTFRIYRPFAARRNPTRWAEDVVSSRIPFPHGTKPPTQDRAFVRDLSLDRKFGLPTDSLRVDFYPAEDDRGANDFVERLLGIVRWWTNQWWVTRDRRHSYSALANHFTITSAGERVSGIAKFASLYGFLGFERPLDGNIWRHCLELLMGGQSIPLGRQILLDAVYFHSVGDLRRSILEGAIANEILLAHTMQALILRSEMTEWAMEDILGGNSYLKHLERFGALCGRSFQAEHPDHHAWIRAVWVARGEIAHGKSGVAPTPTGNRVLTETDMVTAFRAIGVLTDWLNAQHPAAAT
jgi:hypothetical protein